jgi:hypothetical protein
MTATPPAPTGRLTSPAEVLGFARSRRADADRAEADVLAAAVAWAEQHPPESIHPVATWVTGGAETAMPLAGAGAPLVAEFCIAEFALAIGRSHDSGRALIADALELKYRLPRVFDRVQCGELSTWKARRIAQATLGLSKEAAGFVDTQVAGFAHKVGPAALDRLVTEATYRFMPDKALADAQDAAEARHVRFHHLQVSFTGTTFLEAELDLGDALDLDAAITHRAAALAAAGCRESLDVRRAMAAGDLARRQLALDLQSGADRAHDADDAGEADNGAERARTRPRQVVLYVHLSQDAIDGSARDLHLARVENHRQVLTAAQVQTWCANPDTQVIVKPVIDLNEHLGVEAYEVPDRLAEHTTLVNDTCVFPWCARSARRCDHDHTIAHADGGTTCTCNLAPLCRRHHRLKTHTTWTYTLLEPGSYLWSSPRGYQFLRDHTGTADVTPQRPPPRAADPPHF